MHIAKFAVRPGTLLILIPAGSPIDQQVHTVGPKMAAEPMTLIANIQSIIKYYRLCYYAQTSSCFFKKKSKHNTP